MNYLVIFPFLGIQGYKDTASWYYDKVNTENGKTPCLIAWIHSHVGGVKCNFSSVDLHTHHSYNKIHDGILGLVLEIHENGELITHDFFVLSRIGKKNLEQCSRQKECNSRLQHESCNNPRFYQSANDCIILNDDFALEIKNFMPSTIEFHDKKGVIHVDGNDETDDSADDAADDGDGEAVTVSCP